MYRTFEDSDLQPAAPLRLVDSPPDEADCNRRAPAPGDFYLEAAEDHACRMIRQLDDLVYALQNWEAPADRLLRAKMVAEHAATLVKWLHAYCPLAVAVGGLGLLGLRALQVD